ncbi:hypothetical protein [Streptomyces sp. NPDC059176]|uniref:hypothetical protein n=1 Tax=unclassified Streptomyces TaxID=2593676 RepID=UPI00368B76DA
MTVAGSPVPSYAMMESPDRKPSPRDSFDLPIPGVAPDPLGRTLVRHTEEGPIEFRSTEVEACDGEADGPSRRPV